MALYGEAQEVSQYLLEQVKSESWFGGVSILHDSNEGFYVYVRVINIPNFLHLNRLDNVLVTYSCHLGTPTINW